MDAFHFVSYPRATPCRPSLPCLVIQLCARTLESKQSQITLMGCSLCFRCFVCGAPMGSKSLSVLWSGGWTLPINHSCSANTTIGQYTPLAALTVTDEAPNISNIDKMSRRNVPDISNGWDSSNYGHSSCLNCTTDNFFLVSTF